MKKILTLIIAIILIIALSGCEGRNYYTQEEVDELINNAINECKDDFDADVLLKELEERIEELEKD